MQQKNMTAKTTNTYTKIPRDTTHRHLVIGDIHGRFNTLIELLDKANYNPESDILVSVGDLIDRGPRSVEVIDFFAAPNRYAVRGNHEQMVLNNKKWLAVWSYPQNGGPATNRSLIASNRDLAWLQHQVSDYPVCLDIGDENDKHAFRIVHAEQPFNWTESKFRDFLKHSNPIKAGESRLLWGRDDVEHILDGIMPRLHPKRSMRRTFCGHTPIERITQAHNTYWIDTFEAGTLSCIDAVTLDEWSVTVHDDEMPE